MKNYPYLGLAVCLSIQCLPAQTMPELKAGDKLVYEVSTTDQTYNFTVTLTDLSNGIRFNWAMSDPINQEGSITITPDALKKSMKYHNYFQPGSMELNEECCVFTSQKNLRQITSKKSTQMDMQDGNKGTWAGSMDQFSFIYKGEEIYPQAYYLLLKHTSSEGYREVVVVPCTTYGLIVSMSLDWSIRLRSVE